MNKITCCTHRLQQKLGISNVSLLETSIQSLKFNEFHSIHLWMIKKKKKNFVRKLAWHNKSFHFGFFWNNAKNDEITVSFFTTEWIERIIKLTICWRLINYCKFIMSPSVFSWKISSRLTFYQRPIPSGIKSLFQLGLFNRT